MKAPPETKGAKRSVTPLAARRIVALIVAADETGETIAGDLRRLGMDVHLTPSFGTMASTLFDKVEPQRSNSEILFVLDLRISCGASKIEARLGDYDAVLNAQLMAGNQWPRTLCLVDAEQTRPAWLQARPHLRSTLLADEVETVVGHPQQRGWQDRFASALRCCLRA
jgi:hypothetical protein